MHKRKAIENRIKKWSRDELETIIKKYKHEPE
jgi:hypothetical protein